MQPENQQGTPVPPASQPPQPLPPVPAPVQQVAPQPVPQPVATPPVAAPMPVTASQQPASSPAPTTPQDALGSVAVADQVENEYDDGFDDPQGEYDPGEIDLSQPVTWQAKEYIHQEKGTAWFIGFAIVLALFMVVAVFLMRSWSFAILLVVIAAVIVVLAKRPPRVMDYALSEEGLHIDNTLHKYVDFKSFGVIRDGEEFSIMLIPRRRLQPGITVYFPEESGEDIVDVLGSRLPMRDLHLDIVDKLVRKLRL